MDNLTHSLVGAVLAQAGLKQKTGLALPALVIGANIPDIDAACFFWLEGVEHVGFRRGITHGPPAMVLLPLLLAGALWWFDRWQAGRGKRPEKRLPVHFGWLYALSFIGCLSHPALDFLNVYGVRFLEPFSSTWSYGDTLFIIDVWLWALLIGSVWWSVRRERRGGNWRLPAWIGILVGLVYIGANGVWSQVQRDRLDRTMPLLECAEDAQTCSWTIIASPAPIFFWERQMIANSPQVWSEIPPGEAITYDNLHPISDRICRWPKQSDLATGGTQAQAFLFWSRAPFAERAEDGSVILRDARFYDPRARDRFSVALPDVECEEMPEE